MEANTFEVVWKRKFANAGDLVDLLEDAAIEHNVSLDEIDVDICGDGDRCGEKSGVAVLEAEALSDSSVVYNIALH